MSTRTKKGRRWLSRLLPLIVADIQHGKARKAGIRWRSLVRHLTPKQARIHHATLFDSGGGEFRAGFETGRRS